MIKNILLVISGLLMLSCAESKYRDQLNEIDSLIVVVDKLQNDLIRFNMDSVHQIIDTAKVSLEKLKYSNPPVDRNDYIKHVSFCYDIHKSLNRFVGKYYNYQSELTISAEQLKSLRYDISNELLNDSLVYEYLGDERMILNNLAANIRTDVDEAADKLELFETSKDQIEKYIVIIDSLDTK